MAEAIITTSDAEFRGILEGRSADVAGVALTAIGHRTPPPHCGIAVPS